ncbi:CRAL/TRIO domain-containing protein [Coprinopsis cinerea okayama7|uniref:CRAL/TRIO domain-containing protein n=1 Tax=Coprinopsis cinerea (strain Okayama-7 / 130 / ATCC MYA-4618 / FGSC 9003) TaxID=240176 RepID=D6RM76_COPC7|nr:CRAL/TRIO domain-containing protein [Coprinopsis cinerea okayama7\|eukprot:XP_002911368.1 CRAL/TRIO domain-containing protein [Coprinopsis cinerea okayama7\
MNRVSSTTAAVTGKHVYFGYDVEGRPAFYAFPSRQNTDSIDGHLKFAFWMVERGIELMGPGVETLTHRIPHHQKKRTLHILLNFAERASKPSISEATSLIHIMQEHYPERLGLCSIINIPFFINAFLKLVLPFLDPRTRGKLRFNQRVVGEEEQEEGVGKEKKGKDKDKVSEKDKTKEGSGGGGLFKRDMLMKEWEGDRVFEYVHEKYWPALLEMCEKNVQKWMRRWRELGGTVGISEWDYKHEAGELGAGASTTASGKVSENGAANQISGNGSANQESANGSVNQQPSTNGHPIANGNHGDAATSDPPPKEAKPSASSPESKMTSDSLSSSTTLPTACPVVEAPKSN